MLTRLIAGMAAGGGVLLVVRGLVPRPPALAAALADLERPRRAMASPGSPAGGAAGFGAVRERLGDTALRLLRAIGMAVERDAPDLRVTGCSVERFAADKVVTAWAFAVIALATTAVLSVGGVALPWGAVALVVLGGAAAGFVVPDLSLRARAEARRRELRHALGAFLDLAVIVVAGGGGVETALHHASASGEGWAFTEIRRALDASRLAGEPPWAGLTRLADALDVGELRELAASMGLAGEHGARVRSSLSAKAASIREHQMAEVRAEAEEATEKMSVPTVLMLFGFIAFVLYPALQFVLEGL